MERSHREILLARRHALLIEQARDAADAHPVDGIAVVDHADHAGLGLQDLVIGHGIVALADVAIAIGRSAEHADLPLPRAVALAAAGSFEDLRPLVFRDHALELQQQLVLRCRRLWRLEKHRFDTMASKFLDQQDLVGILPAQPVGSVHQHGMNLPFRRQVAHPLQPGALEGGTAIAFVFEDPLVRHLKAAAPREVDQRRRLAGDGVLLPLLVR